MSDLLLPVYKFLAEFPAETKEHGHIKLGTRLLGTQRRLMNEMGEGMERGVREFVTLKARQLGISTVSLGFDLYWVGKHKGISGALIVHDEKARDQFRTIIEAALTKMPARYRRPIKQHNRHQLVFAHGSSLQYRIAGTRATGGSSLGRSAALTFCHATEAAFWGDPRGIDSLVASFAQQNPIRFYHWESTANGFNHFYDMWMSAKDSVAKKAIFIGPWANELYRARKHGEIWQAYWGAAGKLTKEERALTREVKALYKVELEEEFWGWYRWIFREQMKENELMMQQEMPLTEYQAFVATGSQFFTAQAIGEAYRRVTKESPPTCYKLQLGSNFADTALVRASLQTATLKVWAEPETGGQYVLGADPAYGSSEYADRYAISVWRCYADKIEQVAEFCTVDLATHAFAWVMVYLAGAYEPCTWNLEVNGPGQAVLAELQNLSKLRTIGPVSERGGMQNVLRAIRTYLYRKYDSLYSQPTAIHTQTTFQQKERYTNAYKDYFERGLAVPHSRELVDEMKGIVRQEGSQPEAGSTSKDDRFIAACLAVMAWNDQVRGGMMVKGDTYQYQHRERQTAPGEIGARVVQNMMQQAGFTQAIKKAPVIGASGGAPGDMLRKYGTDPR